MTEQEAPLTVNWCHQQWIDGNAELVISRMLEVDVPESFLAEVYNHISLSGNNEAQKFWHAVKKYRRGMTAINYHFDIGIFVPCNTHTLSKAIYVCLLSNPGGGLQSLSCTFSDTQSYQLSPKSKLAMIFATMHNTREWREWLWHLMNIETGVMVNDVALQWKDIKHMVLKYNKEYRTGRD